MLIISYRMPTNDRKSQKYAVSSLRIYGIMADGIRYIRDKDV